MKVGPKYKKGEMRLVMFFNDDGISFETKRKKIKDVRIKINKTQSGQVYKYEYKVSGINEWIKEGYILNI